MTSQRVTKSEIVFARIEPDLLEKIRQLADAEDRTVSAVVRRLLSKALEEQPRPSG